MVCLVNRKEAENKEEIRAARSPRGFSNLDFKNEGSKSAQSHLINEIETDSIDLSRLDQTFLKIMYEARLGIAINPTAKFIGPGH